MNNETKIFIPSSDKQRNEACKVTKLGGMNKANRMVKIEGQRSNLEDKFMKIASKANRADKQRSDRRAKR